ncbi:hypothetical protein EC988_006476 [Linderina pennispora]|nr:hypothetical protein EC988_006476 [Linderina pennispora]
MHEVPRDWPSDSEEESDGDMALAEKRRQQAASREAAGTHRSKRVRARRTRPAEDEPLIRREQQRAEDDSGSNYSERD